MNALKTFFLSPFVTAPSLGKAVTKPAETNYVAQELARRAGLDVLQADDGLMSLLSMDEDDDALSMPLEAKVGEFFDHKEFQGSDDLFMNQFTGHVDPSCTGGLADPFGSMG
jgi:hypothetical protein